MMSKQSMMVGAGLIALLTLLINLGLWQLHRAESKRHLLYAFEHAASATPLPDADAAKPYQNTIALGQWDGEHNFLLTSQYHNHQLGYHVLTPFKVPGKNYAAILVDRGWVPKGQPIPKMALPEEATTVIGKIYKPKKQRLVFDNKITDSSWPKKLNRFDPKLVQQQLGYSVYPYLIELTQPTNVGFAINWKPVNVMPKRHVAYALQWFTMAAVLAMIMLSLFYRRWRSHR